MSKYKCLECLDCRELLYGWSVNDRCPNCGGELRKADDDDKKYPGNRKYLKAEGYHKGGEVLNIKVFCKTCNWTGQATVGKRGFDLEKYKCPKCGHSLKRGKGSYDFNSESAQLIGHSWP